MPNTYKNKVVYNGTTLIDLTTDTALASDVAAGKYFHLPTGERVVGTASGGGGDTYTRTVVVPQQTLTPNSDRVAEFTYVTPIVDGEYYVVTLDGTEYVATCETLWGNNITIGDAQVVWQTNDLTYPFAVITEGSDRACYFANTSQHTLKVELLEFVDGPLTIIPKSVTANGTYSASSDNADGYSSVTVNVPTGSSNEFVVTMTLGQDDLYYPDCTYAEARQALSDNKTLVFFAANNVACSYEWDSSGITYYVDMLTDAGYGDDVTRLECRWTSSGVTFVGYEQFIIPSGSQSITTNDTYDVTRLSSVTVSVPTGGSSMNVQTAQSTTRVASTTYTKTASLTCSVSGTYDVYWDCFRSSTSGTSGSQLYIGGSEYGNPNTTFASNIHAQTNHLTGVTISANQEVAVYVRSRATNYYAYCGQLTIVQTA